jgi:Dos2-interacting transcription regulator of RNA-Pol-II
VPPKNDKYQITPE